MPDWSKVVEDHPELGKALVPRLNKYIPHTPFPKQAAFLLLNDHSEVFFGGAAGGGKSDALLMAALQYVDVKGYSALILRRTYADLSLPEAIMDRARKWLMGTDARWVEADKTFRFPSGATLTFGYLEHENDKYRYQSAEFQFVGFDELTQFTKTQYLYLFSRLRRLKDARVPIRMRSASNPGNVGHEWVKERFIDPETRESRVFIPASIGDNPAIDAESYMKGLMNLDPVTRSQLLSGDWSARNEGGKFKREWFEVVPDYPKLAKLLRYWDLASTSPKPGEDPDYTCGGLVGLYKGIWYIVDMKRVRTTPQNVEVLIRQVAEIDGRGVPIAMEQEPGSSGVNTIDHYRRYVLVGFSFRGHRSTGQKEVRANPVSSAAEAGNVKLVRGRWIPDFLEEAEVFPWGAHDDQVDVVSGCFELMSLKSGAKGFVR